MSRRISTRFSQPPKLHLTQFLSFALLTCGREQAGNEVLWAQEMMPEFEKRARTDSDIRDMVSEVKSRREFGIQG